MGFFDKLRDGRQDKVFEEKLLYLKKYHRDAELISYKVENIVEIPESWKKIFCMNKKEERSAATITIRISIFANELRNTILYLEENLLDVNLIKYQGKYSILYSILSSNKKVLYYEGGNCNTTHFPGNYNLNWTTFQTASSGSIKNFITASFTMQAEEWDC